METVSRERPVLQSTIALVSASILGAGGLLFGFALLFLTLIGVALATGIWLPERAFAFLVLSLVFVQGIGCAGVALGYYKLRPVVAPRIRSLFDLSGDGARFDIPAAVPDFRDAVVIVGGYVVALAGAIGGSILVQTIQNVTGTNLDTGSNAAAEIGAENPEVLLLLIPASVLIIGPGEELLFRGVVQGRIRELFSPVPGVFIPSVIFAGLHWFAISGGSPQGNLVALGILVVPSLVFGAAYEYSDNIVVPSLIHGFYNATLFTLLYVAVVYGDELSQQAVLGLGV